MMLMTGSGVLAAAIPVPEAQDLTRRTRLRLRVECQRPPRRQVTPLADLHLPDDVRRPGRLAPMRRSGGGASPRGHGRPTYWEYPGTSASTVTTGETCSSTASPTCPPRRKGRQHLFTAASSSGSGEAASATLGSPDEAELPHPGLLAGWYMATTAPVNGGEVDVMEWYGNALGRGTAGHAKLNRRRTREPGDHGDSGWHTGASNGMTPVCASEGLRRRRATVLRRAGELSLPDWQFNEPGYQMFPDLGVLRLPAPGAATPDRVPIRRTCSVDWVRVW